MCGGAASLMTRRPFATACPLPSLGEGLVFQRVHSAQSSCFLERINTLISANDQHYASKELCGPPAPTSANCRLQQQSGDDKTEKLTEALWKQLNLATAALHDGSNTATTPCSAGGRVPSAWAGPERRRNARFRSTGFQSFCLGSLWEPLLNKKFQFQSISASSQFQLVRGRTLEPYTL